MHCHGLEGVTDFEIGDLLEGFNAKTIGMLAM